MRSPSTWLVAALIVVLAGVLAAQQGEIGRLRSRSEQQSAFLGDSQQRLLDLTGRLADAEKARADANADLARWSAAASGAENLKRDQRRGERAPCEREDERRLILGRYENLLARMNLPAGAADRLKDLLVERSEARWDAQDVAEELGIARGTAEMTQAMAQATAGVDREISRLVGPGTDWRKMADGSSAYDGALVSTGETPPVPVAAYAPALAPSYTCAPAQPD